MKSGLLRTLFVQSASFVVSSNLSSEKKILFYAVSKVGFFFITPSNICWFLIGCGLLLMALKRWPNWAWRCSALGFALLMMFGYSPLGDWIGRPLEQRFAAVEPARPGEIEGIIFLGGFEQVPVSKSRGQLVTNASGERLSVMPVLALRYPTAKMIFTGGAPSLVDRTVDAGDFVAVYLENVGVPPDRIVIERASRNTWENALLTRDLLGLDAQGARDGVRPRYLLVTSAWHMPRSIGVFRKAGFNVQALQVDYRTRAAGSSMWPNRLLHDGLEQLDLVVKEWVGLFVYWITGRTSSLFPRP